MTESVCHRVCQYASVNTDVRIIDITVNVGDVSVSISVFSSKLHIPLNICQHFFCYSFKYWNIWQSVFYILPYFVNIRLVLITNSTSTLIFIYYINNPSKSTHSFLHWWERYHFIDIFFNIQNIAALIHSIRLSWSVQTQRKWSLFAQLWYVDHDEWYLLSKIWLFHSSEINQLKNSEY